MYFSVKQLKSVYKLAGYSYFIDKYSIEPPLISEISCISDKQNDRTDSVRELNLRILNYKYKIKDNDISNIVFILKNETIDLFFIKQVFSNIKASELQKYISNNISGKYAKKLYFLYEYLICRRLNIKAKMVGGYVDILEPEKYFTADPVKVKKYRINDNFLGNRDFNPVLRKNGKIKEMIRKNLSGETDKIIKDAGEELLRKASNYLYTKETKSSYEIERERPTLRKINRFTELLRYAGKIKTVDKEMLISLQNEIVLKTENVDHDYRKCQNYIGSYYERKPIIHFISPKPGDLDGLMEGLLKANQRMATSHIDPLVRAAVISYGFVFMHPFSDGNGRIHRYLIHSILASSGYVPENVVVPVSASMLSHPDEYDKSLETFSVPAMKKVSYTIDTRERVKVLNYTRDIYIYFDYTKIVEYLFSTFEKTLKTELKKELQFLKSYERAYNSIDRNFELSPREINKLINIIRNNDFSFPKRKLKMFAKISEQDRKDIAEIVKRACEKFV